MPRLEKIRHKAVATMLLPTSDPVPNTAIQGVVEDLSLNFSTPSQYSSFPLFHHPMQPAVTKRNIQGLQYINNFVFNRPFCDRRLKYPSFR